MVSRSGITTKKLLRRWLGFNIRGEGSRKSTRNAKNYYIGPVFYTHGWPIARLAELPDGNFACLNKHHVNPKNPPEWGTAPKLTKNLTVPDVAAFSAYDGDWFVDVQMHERLRGLWLKIAAYQVEHAREMAFPTLVNLGVRTSGEQLTLRAAVEAAMDEYTAYRAAFKLLGWPPFPTVYATELNQVIKDRTRAYFSPEEIAKRDRIAARAGAKKALGLEGE
jgi:hypothetical protein